VSPLPECLQCGVCCFSALATYVRVTGDDYDRMGDQAPALVHFVENKAYLKMVDGHCAALVVDPETEQFVCSAYEVRPTICRELERGSPECLGEREAKGARPVERLIRLRAQKGKGPTL